jgi:hypothetical protein
MSKIRVADLLAFQKSGSPLLATNDIHLQLEEA